MSGAEFTAIAQLGFGIYPGWESLMSRRSADLSAVLGEIYTVQCWCSLQVPEHGNQGFVQVWQITVSNVRVLHTGYMHGSTGHREPIPLVSHLDPPGTFFLPEKCKF